MDNGEGDKDGSFSFEADASSSSSSASESSAIEVTGACSTIAFLGFSSPLLLASLTAFWRLAGTLA